MPGGREIRAGKAYVELGVQDKLQAGLNKAAAKFKSIGSVISTAGLGLAAIGTSLLAPLGAAALAFADMGSEIHDASARTGVAADQLSALKYAAEQSGSSLDELEGGLRKMSKTLAGADEESKQATKTLAKLGLSIEDLEGLAPDKQFEIIGERLQAIQDPTLRAAAAMEIFGKNGTALLPMLDGLADSMKRAQDLGLIITPEDADAADKFGDVLHDLWMQAKMVVFQIGAGLAVFQPYLEGATRITAKIIEWVKENRSLVAGFAAAGAGLVAAGTALVALGASLSGIGVLLATAATAVAGIGLAFAALVSPIGLVAGALIGLSIYILKTSDAGSQALGYLADKFADLKNIAVDAFGGISDAFAAGDLTLAVKILWAGLKLAFVSGTADIKRMWIDLKASIVGSAVGAFNGVAAAWEVTKSVLAKSWIDTAALFQTAWVGAVAGVKILFDDLTATAIKAALDIAAAIDPKMQVDSLKQLVDAASKQNQVAIATEAAQRLSAIEKEKKAKEDANTAATADNLRNIVTANSAELDAIDAAAASQKDAINQEIADLKGQLAGLKGKAAQERAAAGGEPGKPTTKPDFGAVLSGTATAVAARGTFNAASILSLQSDPVQERIAKAAEATAKNTQQLKNNQQKFT